MICSGCGYEKKYYTSKRNITETPTKGGATFEVNSRFVMAMGFIGKGFADIRNFYGLMNMPPPMKKDTSEIT